MGSDQDVSSSKSRGMADSPNRPASTPTSAENQNVKARACVACRDKHLKCDALNACSRCVAQDIPCVYLKSRRGYRTTNSSSRQVDTPNAIECGSSSSSLIPSVSDDLMSMSFDLPNQGSTADIALIPPVANNTISRPLELPSVSKNADPVRFESRFFRPNYPQRCLEAFYQYVYDAHPFLSPRQQLLEGFKQTPMEHLRTAICYVGSRYVPGAQSALFALDYENYLSGIKIAPKDASMVQAMLLYALGLHGNNEWKKAVEVLVRAQTLATELGMGQREYSYAHGRGSAVCEESLRRTWWELYVVSMMMAGFHGTGIFYHRDSLSNVPLPCEEKEFASGYIPQLHTVEQLDEETFGDEDIQFSSYAYRIAAARNLERVLKSKDMLFPEDPALYRLEAHLTNWHLHLPNNKRDMFDQFGMFDEMLFQAHMIANLSILLLYRHFSPLDGLAVRDITSCTGESGVARMGAKSDIVHAQRTIQAASNISKLVTLPGPLVKHTQFFVCALVLSSITHLSSWATLPVMSPDQDLKQQIRMNEGALKAVASIWPSAGIGLEQVTMVARNIYASRRDNANDEFWRNLIEDDFIRGLIEGAGV